ncbi:MAG: glycosyltransferase family 2 protein [Lachnospiraceae bacterium]|nr:glycosyltransferase family 2 protein [Lachnospiraceae bacterium]
MSEENRDLNPEQMASYYKELYKKEKDKNKKLTRELTDLEAEYTRLRIKVDRLKKSLLYRMIYPLRLAWSHLKNAFIRVRRYGSIKELVRKIKSKRIERAAYKYHGTESFLTGEELEKAKARKFKKDHVFSILIPLYNTPEKFLRELLDSVNAQIYEGWELCFADGSDEEHGYVADIVSEYAARDGRDRIKYKKLDKNGGISENTNACFELATGDYYALMDHDDLLHPSAFYEFMKVLDEKDALFIYSDEATFKGDSINDMVTLHFKPDFAVDNLRANNYICHLSAFKRELVEKAGKFRSEYDGSQDHDLILRLTHEASKYPDGIVHVPHILYYWRSHSGSTAANINAKTYAIEAAKKAVASALERDGMEGFEIHSSQAFATIFRLRYKLLSEPKISIIIPNKDHVEDLRRCIDSIMLKSSYENYEIVIVENGSTTAEIRDYYGELEKAPCIRIVEEKQESFNFSGLINRGAAEASGEYLLFLNNDTEVISRDWIEELLMYAQRPDVGAVGGILYYPDHTVQHAGVVIGLGAHRTAGHVHYRLADSNLGYMGRLCYAQDFSAVTGACLMVSKEDFDACGGLDTDFAVALNDVDFCLKLRHMGRVNVFTPYASLYHYESASRGSDVNGEDGERAKRYEEESEMFRRKWAEDLEKGDPYFNPNFSLDHSNFTLKVNPQPMVQ